TRDEEAGRYAVYAFNRSVDAPTELVIDLAALGAEGRELRVTARTLSDPDVDAANTLDDPERVAPADLPVVRDGDTLRLELPAVSWTEVLLG
ncbi:MAG: alpha-L-arabinofuranosidase, partial [Actinobacteria bacterium]|nr:alpha-L-arabinofuranosidase [Actinomycetota bacterium]